MRFRCELDSRCHNTALLDGEGGKIKQHTRSLLTLGKLFGTEKAKQPHFPVFCDQRKHFSLIYRWQLNKSLMMSSIFCLLSPEGFLWLFVRLTGVAVSSPAITWCLKRLLFSHPLHQFPPPQQTTDAQSLNIYKGPLCWAVRQILDFNKHWRKFGPWTIDVISMWWRSFKIIHIYFWWYTWTTLFLFQNCRKFK